MTKLSIGRVGVSTANGGDGLELDYSRAWDMAGGGLTLTGIHKAASQELAIFFLNQIVGLDPVNNPDEEWVPVVLADQPSLDGYYRPRAANATIHQGGLGTGGTLFVEWQVVLDRAQLWRRPRVEIPMVGTGLTNSMGVTTWVGIESAPDVRENVVQWASSGGGTAGNRGTDLFPAFRYITGLTVGSSTYNGTIISHARPSVAYGGAARIERTGLGQIVGRGGDATGTSYVLSNDLIRVVLGDTYDHTLQWKSGGSWVGTKQFRWLPTINAYITPLKLIAVAILKNSPEECVLRLIGEHEGSGYGNRGAHVDLSLRRGDRLVRAFCSTKDGTSWRMDMTPATACTSTTWGLRTTATTDGQHVVMMSSTATTKDTANGRLSGSSGTKTVFGFGASGQTATPSAHPDGADSVSAQFYAVYGETTRVAVG